MLEQILTWILRICERLLSSDQHDKLRIAVNKLSSDTPNGKSARAGIMVFSVRIISAALAFVLQVFLARWMGSAEYGIFVLVWVVVVVLGGLSCFGLQAAVIRFITEYRAKNQISNLYGILIAAPGAAVTLSLIVAVSGLIFLSYFGDVVTKIYVLPFYLSMICLPMLTLEGIQDGIARSFDKPLTAFGPSFLLRPIGILLIMAIAIYIGYPADAITAISAAIIATFLSTLFQALMLWRQILRVIKSEAPEPSASVNGETRKVTFEFKYWLHVALPVFMASGFFDLLTNMDVIFVGYFLDASKVALYFAALKSLALVHFVHFAIRAVSAHHFSRFYSDGNFSELSQYAHRITQWSFWPTLALGVIMVIAGKYVLMLFGDEFVDGQSLLAILAIGIVARSAVGPAESLLSMTGHQYVSVVVLAATLLCNLVLNAILIPKFGVAGAAIGTSLAIVFESIALYAAVKRRLGLNVFVFGHAALTPTDKGQAA